MLQLFRCNRSGNLAEFVMTDLTAEQLVSTREYNLSKTVMPSFTATERTGLMQQVRASTKKGVSNSRCFQMVVYATSMRAVG